MDVVDLAQVADPAEAARRYLRRLPTGISLRDISDRRAPIVMDFGPRGRIEICHVTAHWLSSVETKRLGDIHLALTLGHRYGHSIEDWVEEYTATEVLKNVLPELLTEDARKDMTVS